LPHGGKSLGVKSVPSVVVDGKLASSCVSRGVEETTLRRARSSPIRSSGPLDGEAVIESSKTDLVWCQDIVDHIYAEHRGPTITGWRREHGVNVEDSVDARSAKAKGEREGDASGERGQGVLAQREFT
jgi:hypothetical protein